MGLVVIVVLCRTSRTLVVLVVLVLVVGVLVVLLCYVWEYFVCEHARRSKPRFIRVPLVTHRE